MATKRNGIGQVKRTNPNRDFRRKHLQGAIRRHDALAPRIILRTASSAWLRKCWKLLGTLPAAVRADLSSAA